MHSFHVWGNAYRNALKKHNVQFESTHSHWNVIKQGEPHATANPQFYQDVKDHVHSYHIEISFQIGAKELLKSLKLRGKKIGLVTSSFSKVVYATLDKLDARSYFDCVVTFEDVEEIKPHPEPILKTMRLLQSGASQTVMIGDSASDLLSAKKAGVDSIWYYPKEHEDMYSPNEFDTIGPKFTVRSFNELQTVLSE